MEHRGDGEFYAAIAHDADVAVIELRCRTGFAPFAAELRARAR